LIINYLKLDFEKPVSKVSFQTISYLFSII